ncbi:hypothetical protein [Variovorax saccharolyticus]|uniref:hypothetical protein n=1 Tax=Variovorax saccharolyticus TaxID=3053516 RepID=UPI00257585E0|nr:hypothetical protein [Variovorax sp. J22R187]MDM0019427.1 hypothetical protein [Variovorax sp. J22R187]
MEPRIDRHWRVPLPVYRRLRVFAFDPGTTARFETAVMNEMTLLVPWEDLQPGPIGEYVAVVDKDDKGRQVHAPVDLDDPQILANDGLAPSDGNPQFHHQMAYAVAMRTIRNFERALGRSIHWPPAVSAQRIAYRRQLAIYPHYVADTNAYYKPDDGLCLGYFRAGESSAFAGTTVFTCLSQDVIAHEITHAILGGMRISFKGKSPDVLALHEAYADLIAVLQHFWPSDVFRGQIAAIRGKLENSSLLGAIGPQFGEAIGRPEGIRNALGSIDEAGVWHPRKPDPKAYAATLEPHERGAIVVSAVFEALRKIHEARTSDLRRIATKGSGILPEGQLQPDLVNRLAQEASRSAQRVLEMIIRALDYMPPVETTCGDFLRAIVTADYDIRPVDDGNYRLAFIDAFRSYGIPFSEVGTLSQDTILWRAPAKSDATRAVSEFVRELSLEFTPWTMPRDREALWKLLEAKRAQLHQRLSASPIGAIGPVELRRRFEVESFHPRERSDASGNFAFQWIIKLVQEVSTAAAKPKARALQLEIEVDVRPWAGVTLIVDADTGQVRYQIERKTRKPPARKSAAAAVPKVESTPIAPLAQRLVRVFAFDPSMGSRRETAGINETLIRIPWERDAEGADILEPGPAGEYIEVLDRDPASQCFYEPVDLNDRYVVAQHGLPPSESSPQFHQQMVYAVAMRTIRTFERALGRLALWRARGTRDAEGRLGEDYVRRLRIYPHALREPNAYYSPDKVALLFGYFSAPASAEETSARLTVFSCLSHDIVAHEVTHALLDGMHRRFSEPSNPDVLAFHEAFADIVALFQHFSLPEVLRHQIASTRGDLAGQSELGQLAQEFGQAIGSRGALRSAIGTLDPQTGRWQRLEGQPGDYQRSSEPHARGAVLVAAVFDAFLSIYKGRVADLFRIASEGTGVTPEGSLHPDLVARLTDEASQSARQVLDMCIRALDYCPPVDITFGDYLRALITADFENDPVDEEHRRVAFIEAFRRRGIVPENVQAFSVDGLLWRAATAAPDEDEHVVVGIVKEWAKDIRSWGLSKDRRALFELTRDRRAALHAHLKPRLSKESVVLAGIDPELSFEVHSLRPSIRMDWEGRPTFQWVIELTQRIPQFIEGGAGERAGRKADYYFRGGCTLLVDAETGEVRYSIKKKLNEERKSRQRRFFIDEGSRSLAATYFGAPGAEEREPFAVLHRH